MNPDLKRMTETTFNNFFERGLNVLSLFDGMSCGQLALHKAGIKVEKYYASEIDKHAIKVTQHNFPDTIQLGSVTEVNVEELEPIDLLIGGSPCQSFSFAGKRNGMTTSCNEEIYTLERYLELKSDGFQFEGESYLFWEYMRILTDIKKYNPDVLFLLENVEMGAKWERVLSEAIGIYGVHINSALVSAQNRKRIYWTNIRVREEGLFGELHSDIPQPEDRGILLKDILEDNVDEKYYLSNKMSNWLDKQLISGFLNANRMPLRVHENIAVFYKKLPTYNPQYTEGKPLHSKGRSYLNKEHKNENYGKFEVTDDSRAGSTQKYPKSIISFQKPHPSKAQHRTEKSIEMLEWLIKTYTNENEIVLDNTMGSGSTGVACEKTNRRFIGIEKEKQYYDVAIRRLSEYSVQQYY